jgi:signal transduction histidine kinase
MNFKKFFTYFSFLLILLSILLLEFFKVEIYNLFSFLPKYSVDFLSLILAIIVFVVFTQKESESDNLTSDIITVITHKFRTPLAGIKWAVSSLQKDITFTEKETLLREINLSTDKLIEIVNLLVGLNKFDEKQDYVYGAVALGEMIQTSLNKLADKIRERKVVFEISPSNELPLIIIDKTIFQFVMDSIFDNAIKYSKEGGKIKVSFSTDYQFIDLIISDNGIGLVHSEKNKMFKMFGRGEVAKTIDTEGLGLSLYASKTIVENHGGKIGVESEGRDKGTKITIRIPRAK